MPRRSATPAGHRLRRSALAVLPALLLALSGCPVLPSRGDAPTPAEPQATDHAHALAAFEARGGWLVEFQVYFRGPYTATARDAADHPLRRSLELVRAQAAEWDVAPEWYPGESVWGARPYRNRLELADDPAALAVAVQELGKHYGAPKPANPALERLEPRRAVLRLALPQGSAAQCDALAQRLLGVEGVKLAGRWPLESYSTARYPDLALPRAVHYAGRTWEWPTDFSAEEQHTLLGLLAERGQNMQAERSERIIWSGDMYAVNSPLRRLPRFNSPLCVRITHRADGAVDIVDVFADLPAAALPLPTPASQSILSIDAAETGLPLDWPALLRAKAAEDYEHANRFAPGARPSPEPAWRAVVSLTAAPDPAARAAELDALIGIWRADYPLLAERNDQPPLLESGMVDAPGSSRPAQWQVTLWARSGELAEALAARLAAAGVELECLALVPLPEWMPSDPSMREGPPVLTVLQRADFPLLLVYDLHASGALTTAQADARRDALHDAFRAYLRNQGRRGIALAQQLGVRFNTYVDGSGTLATVQVHAADEAERAALEAALAGAGGQMPAHGEFTEPAYSSPGARTEREDTRTLFYPVLPVLFFQNFSGSRIPQLAEASYSVRELEQACALPVAFDNALNAFIAAHPEVARHEGMAYPQHWPDNTLGADTTYNEGLPLSCQLRITMSDPARRAALEAELDAWLHAHVPGLRGPDATGSFRRIF